MGDQETTLFSWKGGSVIICKQLTMGFAVVTAIFVFLFAVAYNSEYLIYSLIALAIAFVLLLVFLIIFCYFVYDEAASHVYYIFTEEKLLIEKRVYKFIPTIMYLFAKGKLDKKKHSFSCKTNTYELRYLIDPGEDNDLEEKQSHFWNGIALVDRKWDYSYDRNTHKKVQLKNIRKIEWEEKSERITEWISRARRNSSDRH